MSAIGERLLFLGVGGMGMAPLAMWLAASGREVHGYDDYLREPVRKLLDRGGVRLRDLLLPEDLGDFDTVVHSSALATDHYLLAAARSHGCRLIRRGEMLSEAVAGKRLVAVAGSHGKTTTSGMIAHGIRCAGLEVGYILGGLFDDPEIPPARIGASDWLVVEVDESDGTIDGFTPEVTVLLNADWDHADRYASADGILGTFNALLRRTRKSIFMPEGDWDARLFEGVDAGRIQVPENASDASPALRGFNRINSAVARSVLRELGSGVARPALERFPGMARRQTVLLDEGELVVLEDYAHHPREIEALFGALRERWPERRLCVVFQPHRYSRTRAFKADFARTLGAADRLWLLPVYAAHEAPCEGGRVADLAAAFEGDRPELIGADLDGLESVRAGTGARPAVVAFVGAGDIGELAHVFEKWVRSTDVDQAFVDYLAPRLSPACVLKRSEPLAAKTTMSVGGAARFFSEPASLTDLRALLDAARWFGLEVFALGRGSNLLVSDKGFDGLVVRLSGGSWRELRLLDCNRIWAGAGVRLKEICGQAAKAGLSGFEFMEGIPGAVGGALRMNAGAMGSWMFDVVERVLYLDEDGKLHDAPREAFRFGYRKVEEISRGIALGEIFRSPKDEAENFIRRRMDSYSSSRKETQPRAPSAGCIFKNPDGEYAGRLIDQLGIKGMAVGAAEVSRVHGNFIVNNGGASSGDVIELVRRVREKVRAETGYELEPEVLLLGESWGELLSEAEVRDE